MTQKHLAIKTAKTVVCKRNRTAIKDASSHAAMEGCQSQDDQRCITNEARFTDTEIPWKVEASKMIVCKMSHASKVACKYSVIEIHRTCKGQDASEHHKPSAAAGRPEVVLQLFWPDRLVQSIVLQISVLG